MKLDQINTLRNQYIQTKGWKQTIRLTARLSEKRDLQFYGGVTTNAELRRHSYDKNVQNVKTLLIYLLKNDSLKM